MSPFRRSGLTERDRAWPCPAVALPDAATVCVLLRAARGQPAAATLVGPSDGIVGAHGRIDAGWIVQAKDERYALADLLCDEALAGAYTGGSYVTLRLTASMYHRFHAPADGEVRRVVYVPGDVWNVNPPALRRVARLFCRNERAVISLAVEGLAAPLLLVPVAAILVASIRLHALGGAAVRTAVAAALTCRHPVTRGEELGWFEHGSTIIVIAPPGILLHPAVRLDDTIGMGQPILRGAPDVRDE